MQKNRIKNKGHISLFEQHHLASEMIHKIKKLVKHSTLTVSELNNSSRWQASNKNWKAARSGILTASNVGKICKRIEETHPENLVKVLCDYNTQPNT